MDKRAFLASGVGAAVVASGTGATSAVRAQRTSAQALQELRAANLSTRSLSILAQVELISQMVSTAEDRAAFIADPVGFANARGVEIDKGFARVMREELRLVEARASDVVDQAKTIAVSNSPEPLALPVVMAASAVVSAAAAVVTAVAATYMATKWVGSST
jgi:hypothetical protein